MLFTPHTWMTKASTFALSHSIVLVAAASQYLQRTMGTPTNAQKCSLAFWWKLTSTGAFSIYDGGAWNGPTSTNAASLNCSTQVFDDNEYNGSASASDIFSAGVVPIDTTTWHHFCLGYDTTQSTASNRAHMYVDGVEVTYGGSTVYPALNANIHFATNTVIAQIGRVFGTDSSIAAIQYTDGKLADFYHIDGQQLTPSSFITGTGSGTCHPQAFSGGAFGAQGFHLSFSASDGSDSSGNGNNWTLFNTPGFSTDVPT